MVRGPVLDVSSVGTLCPTSLAFGTGHFIAVEVVRGGWQRHLQLGDVIE
jgi:uncharacterized protein YaiE (UPF0345 family)